MNRWTDQPAHIEGNDLLYVSLGDGISLHVQSASGLYSATVGNLFGSDTITDTDLAALLERVDGHVGRLADSR